MARSATALARSARKRAGPEFFLTSRDKGFEPLTFGFGNQRSTTELTTRQYNYLLLKVYKTFIERENVVVPHTKPILLWMGLES